MHFLSWILPPFPSPLSHPPYSFSYYCPSLYRAAPRPHKRTSCEIKAKAIRFPSLNPEKLPAVMSQQGMIELLVTERNCQEFGEDESPSKMARRERDRTSRPFSSLSFSSFLSQVPHMKYLENLLDSAEAPFMESYAPSGEGAHSHVLPSIHNT